MAEKTKANLLWSLEADYNEALQLHNLQEHILRGQLQNFLKHNDKYLVWCIQDMWIANQTFYRRLNEIVLYYEGQGVL